MKKSKRIIALISTLSLAVTALPSMAYGQNLETDEVKEQEMATSDLSYEGYNLKWEDEFEGDSLNREDWNVELHEPGWVNSELQEYVDSQDNISVKDGKLYITPVKTTDSEGNVSYTSGRITTQNKEDFTYGLFEVTAKVPDGMGYLPAFWLMATDENVYGQWPRCGEIDCMEVMGQDTTTAYGTIHYGNPHSQSQGTYTLTDGDSFSSSYHKFSCEWEPGVIKWYIDGKLYHEESDWYSTTEGQGTLTYPAPFDQPFYIILNLAVGGSWVGYPDETTSFDNNPYIIDSVKVYQKDSYDENVTKPVAETTIREANADGNYINNGDFSVAEDLTDDSNWKFLTANGGEASATIADNTMAIKTDNEGTVDYSVQLVQADIPFEKGATYQISFDASASADRTMRVDIKAPDHGYQTYMDTQTAELTTTKQTYTYQFKMNAATDTNGRLEYNMGAAGSTADINISNVSIKKIKDADPNEKEVKTVRADGNYIYNGSFQEGDNHLGYWEIEKACGGTVSVTDYKDSRRLKVNTSEATSLDQLILKQEDLPLVEGLPYTLSFSAETDKDTSIKVILGGNEYTVDLSAKKDTYSVTIDDTAKFSDSNITFELGTNTELYLDDITLNSAIPFNTNILDASKWSDTIANWGGSYVTDATITKSNNNFTFDIKNPGTEDWHVQSKQTGLTLENNQTYRVTFKATSTADRTMMSGAMSSDYNWYGGADTFLKAGVETEVSYEFTMSKDDSDAQFYLSLGKYSGEDTPGSTVTISDVSLIKVGKTASDTDKDDADKDDTQADEDQTDKDQTDKDQTDKDQSSKDDSQSKKDQTGEQNNTTPSQAGQPTETSGENTTPATPKAETVTIKKASLKKLSSKKKKQLTVKWSKLSSVDGYEIQVSTSKKFSAKKTLKFTVKNAKTTELKIKKKLSSKKKYYVRVRGYKNVTSQDSKTTVYGKWSTKKSCKTK